MTASEVQARVNAEIGNDWNQTNSHGVALRSCLVAPRRIHALFKTVRDERVEALPQTVWLVLEECPAAKDGYKIVFDENREAFALAFADSSPEARPCIVGYYSDFWSAFQGM